MFPTCFVSSTALNSKTLHVCDRPTTCPSTRAPGRPTTVTTLTPALAPLPSSSCPPPSPPATSELQNVSSNVHPVDAVVHSAYRRMQGIGCGRQCQSAGPCSCVEPTCRWQSAPLVKRGRVAKHDHGAAAKRLKGISLDSTALDSTPWVS